MIAELEPKPRPNHRCYLEVLRSMTPEQRLLRASELSEMTKALLRQGLRERFPDVSEEELHRLFLDRLEECHKQND